MSATPTATSIRRDLKALSNDKIAAHSARFFKSAPGEYGGGDRFLGIRVPVLRRVAVENRDTPLRSVLALLKSGWHEERLLAVLLLVSSFERGNGQDRRKVYEAYLAHRQYVNNWDIVDSSAHLIVGPFLQSRSRRPLYRLAKGRPLWDRRIAMMATYHFIRQSDFDDALAIAAILLNDSEDLIHKVTGWMLREIGNRDRETECEFLQRHHRVMPRTMLRYAIEKFPVAERKAYLNGSV